MATSSPWILALSLGLSLAMAAPSLGCAAQKPPPPLNDAAVQADKPGATPSGAAGLAVDVR